MDLATLARTIASNDPEAIAKQLYNTNPNFKRFMDENKGLSLKEIAEKYGIRA